MSKAVSPEDFRKYFGDLVSVESPIQDPRQDRCIRQIHIGGLDRDVRFIADLQTLLGMVEVARRSPTKRCVVWGAGILMKVFEGSGGNTYSTFNISGVRVSTEQMPSGLRVPIPTRDLRHYQTR